MNMAANKINTAVYEFLWVSNRNKLISTDLFNFKMYAVVGPENVFEKIMRKLSWTPINIKVGKIHISQLLLVL